MSVKDTKKDLLFAIGTLPDVQNLSLEEARAERRKAQEFAVLAAKKARKARRFVGGLIAIFVLAVAVMLILLSRNQLRQQMFLPYTAFGACLLMLFIRLVVPRRDQNDLEEYQALCFKIAEYNERIFLLEIKDCSPEEKALRQLLERQRALNEYHETNKRQMVTLYRWGTGIVLVGIAITMTVLLLIFLPIIQVSNITVIAGLLSGLLVDCVGAVFIAMYSRTLEAALAFEKSIAMSVSNHLGNVIAAQIGDKDARVQAWADMARELSKVKP